MTITVYPYPQAHRAAIAAAGSDAARCAASVARLGVNPLLSLRRDGAKQVEIQFAGSLPVVGNYIEIPAAYASLLLLKAAVKTPGNWEMWIESTDRANRLRCVLNSVDLTLSGDINTGNGFDFASGSCRIGFTAPSPPSTSATVGPNDHRVLCWVDPRLAWAAMPRTILYQGGGTQGEGRNLPEPGLPYPGDGYSLARMDDPITAGRKIIYERVGPDLPGFEADSSGNKYNFRAGAGDGALVINEGVTQWVGVWMRPQAGLVQSGTNNYSLLDFHETAFSTSDPARVGGPGPFQLLGAGSTWTFWSRSTSSLGVGTGIVSRATLTAVAGTAYSFVIKIKIVQPSNGNGRIEVWQKTNNASKTKIIDFTGPVGFHGQAIYYCEQKIYVFTGYPATWGQPSNKLDLHSKGFYHLYDDAPAGGEPPIDEDVIFTTMEAV